MNAYLKEFFFIFYKALFYPEFTLYFLFVYIFDNFLEHHFGNTYLKKTLMLPVILCGQFLGTRLYEKYHFQMKIKLI